ETGHVAAVVCAGRARIGRCRRAREHPAPACAASQRCRGIRGRLVMTAFLALAALMLAAALAFVLLPLMRSATKARVATLGVSMLLPIAAVLLYLYAGSPQALNPAALRVPADHGQDMEQAIAALAAKLQQNPNDAQGWGLLGRAYEAMERFAEARDALAHAHALAPDDADVTVAYAEALALSTESRRVEGEPRA